MARAGCGAEVGVIEGAAVNVPIGNGSSHAPETDVDPNYVCEVFVELRDYGTGTGHAIIAGEGKNLAHRTIKDDGVGNAEGTAVCSAVRSRASAPRRVSYTTGPTPDHYRACEKNRNASAGIDGPEFPQLISHH